MRASKREARREKRREEEYNQVVENIDSLRNPFDLMDIDTKKSYALTMYYEKMKVE